MGRKRESVGWEANKGNNGESEKKMKTKSTSPKFLTAISESTYTGSFPVDVWPRRRRLVVEQRLLGRRKVRIFPQRAFVKTACFDRVVCVVLVAGRRSIGDRTRGPVASITDCRASHGTAVVSAGRPTTHIYSTRHLLIASSHSLTTR